MNGPKVIKKADDLEGSSELVKTGYESLSEEDKSKVRGICGDSKKETVIPLNRTKTEKEIKNNNGASIVLGRDRWGMPCTGYGGRGDNGAAAIDIVVGRMGAGAVEEVKGKKTTTEVDFVRDAARIYISQKTDIDLNFNLSAGRIGSPGLQMNGPVRSKPSPRSGIALKADGIRIIARQGIKLVTRTDARNSQDGSIQSVDGIDIIAGNLDTGDSFSLQPMVKGDNLIEALEKVITNIDKLNGCVDSFLTHQSSFNEKLTNHFHITPFFGQPDLPSFPVVAEGIKAQLNNLLQSKMSLKFHKINLAGFRNNYLAKSGKKYINSRHNNVN